MISYVLLSKTNSVHFFWLDYYHRYEYNAFTGSYTYTTYRASRFDGNSAYNKSSRCGGDNSSLMKGISCDIF